MKPATDAASSPLTAIAQQFPLLRQQTRPFAYLDNAATTQKPDIVLKTIDDFYVTSNANVHRGLYELAALATERFESAREEIADLLEVRDGIVVFTGGTTASLNLLALGLEDRLAPQDVILISELEHHANLLPWMRLAKRTGAELIYNPILPDGQLDRSFFSHTLETRQVKIVALTGLSHVLGNRLPIEDLFAQARLGGAWTVLDAAQMVAHERLSMTKLHCDAIAFSGHKVFAPTGIGVLTLSPRLAEVLEPVALGGGMVSEVTQTEAHWLPAPARFEAGTPPIEGAVALAAALRYLSDLPRETLRLHEIQLIEEFAHDLCRHFETQVSKHRAPSSLHASTDASSELRPSRSRLRLLGWAGALQRGEPIPAHGAILSFAIEGLHAHDIAQTFADHGVAVRAGQHCAQPLMRVLQLDGCVRISLAAYNTREDLELFLRALSRLELE